MKAVLPSPIPLYAVGGVAEDDFSDYVAAGCAGFGIGSHLYHPDMSLSDIRAKARRLMQACDKAFGQMRPPKKSDVSDGDLIAGHDGAWGTDNA